MNRPLGHLLHLYIWPINRRGRGWVFFATAIAGWGLLLAGMLVHSTRMQLAGWIVMSPFLLWAGLLFGFWGPVILVEHARERRRANRE